MSAVPADDRLSRGRARVEERPGGLLVTVPAKRVWFAMVFWTVWAGFVFATVGNGLLSERQEEDGALVGLLGALLFLGVACALVLAVLWMLAGREEAEVADDRLVLRRRLGPLKRERSFDREKVADLRADPSPPSMWSGDMRSFGVTGGGTVLFDYGMRTHRFAAALDEAEAKQIARRVEEALR